MKQRLWLVVLGVALAAAGLWWQARPPTELTVTFFNIGQGDATLIRTPQGQQILIDGGPDRTILRKLGQELPWFERDIDLVILSHPHADHVAGLTYVLERYRVQQILMTDAVHTTPEYLRFLELIKQYQVPVTLAQAGQVIALSGEVNVEVLWPNISYAGIKVVDLNATSIVNRVVYGNTAVLFTGDTPSENEAALVASGAQLSAQILKVAHQGSHTSSTEAFLRAVSPEVAVISVGANNRYGHPHRQIVARLQTLVATVLRTDRDGDITFRSHGRRWQRQ